MNSKVFNNAKWIIVCKVAQSVLALVVSMLSARYLGPSNFGIINYAASLVSFVVPIMYLGVNNIIVQEIIYNPEKEGEVLGTSIAMTLLSSMFCIIGVVSFAYIANPGETATILVCFIYSFTLFFQSTELIQYWFQAKLLSKYTSVIMVVAYFLVSVYKVSLLVLKKSVYWFALSHSLDFFLVSVGMYVVYRKIGGQCLTYSHISAKKLFLKGRYYIVSSMMITIFAQTDKIMLKALLNENAVGYYSAAVSCAGMTSFVFAAIINSMRPVILEKKLLNEKDYKLNLVRLYSIIIYFALAQSVVICLFSEYIIFVLYGEMYKPAASALAIIVWYTTFSYLGAVRDVWILAEEKQRYLWILNLSGACMNVFLNAILIPQYGINGAAFASLITQIFTNVIMGFIMKPIRENNMIMLKGLNPKLVFNIISKLH